MTQSIAGRRAPELAAPYWIDAGGHARPPLTLKELGDRHRLLFFYQHWCPGCHARGFPALQGLVDDPRMKDVGFAAVQTVFEGDSVNTRDTLQVDQTRYSLEIPFGHEGRSPLGAYPATMVNFQTCGTPWFVAIGPDGVILQDGFDISLNRFVRDVTDSRVSLRR